MTDEEAIALYEAEIMNDPDAYTREGECVYQITRTELLAAARAIEQVATRDVPNRNAILEEVAQRLHYEEMRKSAEIVRSMKIAASAPKGDRNDSTI